MKPRRGLASLPEEIGPVEIYTPERMKALLQAATAEVLPALALCGFSGLSRAEVERLDWAEVNLAEQASSHRGIEPGEGEEGAINSHPAESGGVVERLWSHQWAGVVPGRPVPHGSVAVRRLRRQAPSWKEKGLIHSYVSYRLALVPDAQQVAWETGRSPHTVFTKFNGRMPDGEAASWFSIKPESKNLSSGMRD